jgi:hypothetical protein
MPCFQQHVWWTLGGRKEVRWEWRSLNFCQDKGLGLVESVGEFYPETQRQRCAVHFYRNVWTAVPTSKMKEVAAMLKGGTPMEPGGKGSFQAVKLQRPARLPCAVTPGCEQLQSGGENERPDAMFLPGSCTAVPGRPTLSRAQNQYIRAGYQSRSALRAACLCSLLSLCPDNRISGGRVLMAVNSVGTRDVSKRLNRLTSD